MKKYLSPELDYHFYEASDVIIMSNGEDLFGYPDGWQN